MSENGTMKALWDAVIAYAEAARAAAATKLVKDQLIAEYAAIFRAAEETAVMERDAKASVSNVHVPAAREAGLFTQSNRLPLPGIGYVQSTPQPDKVIVRDIQSLLDDPVGRRLVLNVSVNEEAARQLMASGKVPGLVLEKGDYRVAVSIKEYIGG